jgi:hypothetical protein
VTGIAGENRIAARHGQGFVGRAGRNVAGDVGNAAVEAAAAIHQRLLIPAGGQGDAEEDVGAEGSTGEIRAFTRQYSATKAAPAPAAGTTAALITAPPVVGSPMALAGIAMPARSAQDAGVCAAAMGAVQAIKLVRSNRGPTSGPLSDHAGSP